MADFADLPLFDYRPPFPTMEAAHEALEDKHASYLINARIFARKWLATHADITVDTVREHMPPPRDSDPRLMGAIFKRSEFRKVGNRKSKRRECHCRDIGIFVLRQST